MRANPSSDEYRQDAARTRYNRGILRFKTANPGSAEFTATESDFREAIRLLEPLAGRPADPVPSLELARANNNIANLLALDDTRLAEARKLYEAAIGRDEALMKTEPANRVYKMELAQYCNNLAYLLGQLGDNDLAKTEANRRSIYWLSWRCRRRRSASNKPTPTICAATCCRRRIRAGHLASTKRRSRFMRVSGGTILHTM